MNICMALDLNKMLTYTVSEVSEIASVFSMNGAKYDHATNLVKAFNSGSLEAVAEVNDFCKQTGIKKFYHDNLSVQFSILRPYAMEFLEVCKSVSARMYIMTITERSLAVKIARLHNILKFFDGLICKDNLLNSRAFPLITEYFDKIIIMSDHDFYGRIYKQKLKAAGKNPDDSKWLYQDKLTTYGFYGVRNDECLKHLTKEIVDKYATVTVSGE